MSDHLQRTLGNRKWRVLHSAWLLWPIIGFGIATAPAFLYVGLRTKQPRWYIPGVTYGLIATAGFVIVGVTETDSTASNWGAAVLFAGWIPGIIHAAIINRSWLTWLAQDRQAWYVSAYAGTTTATVTADAAPAMTALGIDPFSYHAPPRDVPSTPASPTSERLLDINTATEEDLAALPGMDERGAQEVIAHRSRIGGFRTVDEFALAAKLSPHIFAPIRATLTCSAPRTDQRLTGRILDF